MGHEDFFQSNIVLGLQEWLSTRGYVKLNLINQKHLVFRVSNVLSWIKWLRIKRVTGEKYVNSNKTRLLNVLNGLTHLSPELV